VLTMFAAFDGVLFAYFEVYWAMVPSRHPRLTNTISLTRNTGRPHGSALPVVTVRSWQAFTRWRHQVQRSVPCLCMVVRLNALYVP
jgi:hypothetical protein